MLCVTGAEATARQTEVRFKAAPGHLHELRLDLSEEPAAHLRLLEQWARRVDILVTCRPDWEGGGFRGSERVRAELLAAALRAGARYVDVELRALAGPFRTQAFPPARLVVSAHLWQGAADVASVSALAGKLVRVPAAAVKLAAWTEDVADLAWLVEARERLRDRRAVLVPMGPAGLIGRVRYEALGSAWTYVAFGVPTAPGQVTWSDRELFWGRPAGPLHVILGGPDPVQGSPGPSVYGRWLAAEGLGGHYLPGPTTRPVEALELLRENFGLAGASVTMPHKERVLAACGFVHATAARVGAANTLVWRAEGAGGWWGLNTDVHGIRRALAPAGDLRGRRAVVLGAGGAAAAAVFALSGMGARVWVVARRPSRAQALAERFGVSWARWADLARILPEVLVNATPVGRRGEDVLEEPGILRDAVVLDMVLQASETGLERQARVAGARFVARGVDMWVAQGCAQMRLWFGRCPEPGWLRSAALEALAAKEAVGVQQSES